MHILVVCHGAHGLAFTSIKPVQHASQALRANRIHKPFDIGTRKTAEGLETEGSVVDDDGGVEDGVGGFDLFGGNFFEGCAL